MSNRKSSLRIDRTIDLIQFKNNNFEHSRQRKNSTGGYRGCLQQIQSNVNIKLDQKLTAKFLFVKKLQKLQKEAIKLFYQHKTQQCFNTLEKCLNIFQQKCYLPQNPHSFLHNTQDHNFPQHLLYIRYLQSQFKYKLKLFQQSRQYYQKACKITNKLSKIQRQKNKEYLMSLEVLNAGLLFQQGKYAESIKYIQQLQLKLYQDSQKNQSKINEKTLKQISLTRIQSLIEMRQYPLAIKLIQKFLSQFSNLSIKQRYKINTTLASVLRYTNKNSRQNVDQVMENLIEYYKGQIKEQFDGNFNQTQNINSSSQVKNYLEKSYSFFVQMHSQDLIKAIFLARKWQQDCQNSDQATICLFHLYFKIGDYQEALLQFSQISQNYRKSSEDWQILAQIKQFYGELEAAQHMYSKASELTKNQQRKMQMQIKILNVCSQQNTKQGRKNLQRKIKQNRNKSWITKIIQKYGQYLQKNGQQTRYQKLKKIININQYQDYSPTVKQLHSNTNTNTNKSNNLSFNNGNSKSSSNTNSINNNQLLQTGKFVFTEFIKQKQQGNKNHSFIKKNIQNNSKIIY